ncbi:HAD-IA family hydrolase [Aestuariibacter salexigens]|uniref:HAD-IA family hydrolase n=1 Tax=Aestuariibacter salexigens TaxID=226010 RepID=UPI0004028343|nr:HAD-IA family hydrolase [Aestuariibacter salexigens]
MKYELIIFDWDGTLMDSSAKIVNTMHLASDRLGVARKTDEQVKDIIGISLQPAIMRLFDTDDASFAQRLAEEYKHVYLQLDQTPCPLFDGAAEVLDRLHVDRMNMAVATGKARRGLNRAWQQSGTGHYFVASRCADEAQSKPSPDMLEQILSELDIPPQAALMVGDTEYDMLMAQALGMDRVAVSYGVHDEDRLLACSPVSVIHHIRELLDVIYP